MELQNQYPITPCNNFQQLQVEETNFETPFVGRNYEVFVDDVGGTMTVLEKILTRVIVRKSLRRSLELLHLRMMNLTFCTKLGGKEIDRLEKELTEK